MSALDALTDAGVVYTDEQWDGGIFRKPRWLPRYLEGFPYLGRLCFVRRDLVDAVGGWRPGFDGATEWDLHLRVTEVTDAVVHLPLPGVTRARPPAHRGDPVVAGQRAVAQHYERGATGADVELVETDGTPAFLRVWRAVATPPSVTIVIPTAGGRRTVRGADTLLVTNALRSILARTRYDRFDVVLVVSESTPNGVIEECRSIMGARLSVATVAGTFNFSRSVNTGVAAARGELVLLLNDDVEVIEERWLERMVAVAQDPAVGAVGAKLLFEDGTIQHAGISFDADDVPFHVHGSEVESTGYFGTMAVDLPFFAVTGACLLTGRATFERVGGFTEALPLNYNDVDYCLKLVSAGLEVVLSPLARLFHFETSTRGRSSLTEEEFAAVRWWHPLLLSDPYTNFRQD